MTGSCISARNTRTQRPAIAPGADPTNRPVAMAHSAFAPERGSQRPRVVIDGSVNSTSSPWQMGACLAPLSD